MKINKPDQQLPVTPPTEQKVQIAPELTEVQKKIAIWFPLWLCAAFLLIANLGVAPIKGSEARWMEIVREMFITKDFLHPTINFDPYFDKPLLTYWFIALTSMYNGKVVNEFVSRLPSALAALAALWSVIVIARQFWSTEIARVAAWIFMTCYSFAFWGRLAEADMANLAFSTGAIAWYLAYRKEKSFKGYLVFFLLCFIGAHAKGMATIAVPFLAAFVDMVLSKSFKMHINWKSVLALIIGAAVYMVPFELARMVAPAIAPETQDLIDFDGTVKTSGIALAIRENITRFFAPFDHNDEGFYAYLIHIPRLTIPWSPILILAVIDAFRRRKQLDEPEKWLCWTMIAIFLFFTISGSRRHYYILPIIPFCAIMMSLFISRQAVDAWVEKVKRVILWIFRFIPMDAMIIAIVAGVILALFPSLIPQDYKFLSKMIPQTMISLSAAVFILGMFMFRLRESEETQFAKFMPDRNLAKSIFSIYVIMLLVFVYAIPTASQFRTAKRTFKEMIKKAEQMNVPADNIYFYHKSMGVAVFYLNQKTKIQTVKNLEAVKALRKEKAGQRILLISQHRYFNELPKEELKKMPVTVKEAEFPWDTKKNTRKKYVMRMILPENKKIQ